MEDFVDFETAQMLKRAGFDWKVNNAFSQKMRCNPLSMGEVKEVRCKIPKNFNDNRKGCAKGVDFYSRPSLAQARKWLREVHNWHIRIDSEYDRSWFYHLCPIGGAIEEGDVDFPTYESALIAGINATLGIITDKDENK